MGAPKLDAPVGGLSSWLDASSEPALRFGSSSAHGQTTGRANQRGEILYPYKNNMKGYISNEINDQIVLLLYADDSYSPRHRSPDLQLLR